MALVKNSSAGLRAAGSNVVPPESFDGREVWKRYIKPIRTQGNCGACWAFATTFSLQTRLAIYTGGRYNLNLSPAEMVLCNLGIDNEYRLAKSFVESNKPYDYNTPDIVGEVKLAEELGLKSLGCHGETLLGAWAYLYAFGTAEESCITYGGNEDDGIDLENYTENVAMTSCMDVLSNSYDLCPTTKMPATFHQCGNYYFVPGAPSDDPHVPSGSEINIRRDIYHWGPASTGFDVHQDFLEWDGRGVYAWNGKTSPDDGGHAVVLMGWGVDRSGPRELPYWICRNSWGRNWGEAGYFRILRGSNHCNIEANVVVGFPNCFGFRKYVEWPLLFKAEDSSLRTIWGVTDSGIKTTTLEDMVTGKIKNFGADDVDRFRYDPTCWADVSCFVAGDPSTQLFRIKRKRNAFGLQGGVRKEALAYEAPALITSLLVGAVVGALITYYMVRAANNKKQR
jgi:cathepsin B